MEARNPPIAPLRAAMSWRLLLAWTLAAFVPTLIVTLPLSRTLGDLWDHAARGTLPSELQGVRLLDGLVELGRHPEALQGAVSASLLVTLLLAPFCAGLAVSAYSRPTRFFALVAGAADNYGRLFRLMLVSLIPFAIAGGIAAGVMEAASKHADKAVLESSASSMRHLALVTALILVALAQLTVEAARAQFAADGELRSALRAWGRGLKLIAARPGAALGRYLLPTVLSLLAAALLALLRVRAGMAIGFIATQLAVAAIGWGRAGRILALADLARVQQQR